MFKRHLKIAVVGCGAVTELRHLPALVRRDNCQVVALVDQDQTRARKFAPALGSPSVLADYRDLLDLEIDAAIVALPNYLHAPVSIELLRAGIHVLVEKPMALSVAECDEMLQAERTGHSMLAVGLTRRFVHAARFAKWAVKSGFLGRITAFDIRDGYTFNWPLASDFFFHKETAGGGVLMDTGVHTLDELLWWLGDFESFEYHDNNYGGVESDCEIYIRLKSGAEGIVELSRTRNLRNTAIIRGERAELEVGLWKNSIALKFREGAVGIIGQGFVQSKSLSAQDQIDLIVAEHEDWLESIRTRRPPAVPGTEAIKSIELIEACYSESRPLNLPWIRPSLLEEGVQ